MCILCILNIICIVYGTDKKVYQKRLDLAQRCMKKYKGEKCDTICIEGIVNDEKNDAFVLCNNCTMQYHISCNFENVLFYEENKSKLFICGFCIGFKEPNIMIPWNDEYDNIKDTEIVKCIQYYTKKIKFSVFIYL